MTPWPLTARHIHATQPLREKIKRVIALLRAGQSSGLRLFSSIVEPMTSVKIFT